MPTLTETLDTWVRLLCREGHRVSGSPECRRAAEEIRKGFEASGLEAASEEFTFRPSHPHGLILHYSVFIASTILSLAGAPAVGLAVAVAGVVSVYGSETGRFDILNLALPPRQGANVVGRWNPSGARRLVVVAHYDGTRAGRAFEPHRAKRFSAATKDWPFFLRSPLLLLNLAIGAVFLAALLGLAGARIAALLPGAYGVAALAIGVFIMADWALARPIAGASDNASGVALLLALAARLPQGAPPGLDVWLVATDAEEIGLKGASAFCRMNRRALGEKPTFFVNVDTLGSGSVVALAREGGYVLPMGVRYSPLTRQVLEEAARRRGRSPPPSEDAPVGTDGQILVRNGLTGATFICLTADGYSEHYHWTTDTPENVDLRVVADAVEWTWALAEAWASRREP